MFAGMKSNLEAARDILFNRAEGVDRLDTSADGFWISFKGLILAGIIDIVSLVVTYSTRADLGEEKGSLLGSTLTALAIALISYLVSMVALYFLCRLTQTDDRFPIAFIAHNWAAPLISLGFLPFGFLLIYLRPEVGGGDPNQMSLLVLVFVFSLLVLFGIRILRHSLNVSFLTALALFSGSAFVSILIDSALRSFLY